MNPDALINDLITRAREAQAEYEKFDQRQVDDVVAAIAWTVMEPSRNRRLAEHAVRDTGLGDVDHKFSKN
ncbi:MAG: hypothetical protein QF375_05295, partial [Arenicellales bacterium]|nr:hypothetical protein [Arenicellales bacterium]